ncbi:hypothetical protein METBIDRAFT_197691 [Metschnikowia bicuspidata var. bicuspidata NRRL YB-4993]|uniref:Uncharacterized protein n=1 Tax=Metschnikowia bicuspidata var. bicuspidata NRRL YB-4993 TaxID=869754 RepID=A0A1A0H924_9ASCO|nr:hypothetical protein METBIDRAFT_197691 [Metschnikowia bicuspidata var. bicuspidata NRRL YB-4993]OBA20383.1 hypothetical protein METBIDRAFT_197691 [Metschnikowia bicuspidata var. bicuspidata NRRL YB-4993]
MTMTTGHPGCSGNAANGKAFAGSIVGRKGPQTNICFTVIPWRDLCLHACPRCNNAMVSMKTQKISGTDVASKKNTRAHREPHPNPHSEPDSRTRLQNQTQNQTPELDSRTRLQNQTQEPHSKPDSRTRLQNQTPEPDSRTRLQNQTPELDSRTRLQNQSPRPGPSRHHYTRRRTRLIRIVPLDYLQKH